MMSNMLKMNLCRLKVHVAKSREESMLFCSRFYLEGIIREVQDKVDTVEYLYATAKNQHF